jgi:cobalamin biosynthesis protein CobD/CbiB
MKSQKIEDMSQEALLKQKKTTQLATGMLAGALSVLLVMVVLLAIKKGPDAVSLGLGIIPFALMPIVFMNWTNLQAIKKELNSRQNAV